MTRYFFHIRDGENLLEDEQGVELGSLEDARAEADRATREILIRNIKHGETLDARRFEVWDEEGVPHFILPFKSAIGIE
ncbi:hypothetical protein IHQ71_31070 (plasmid) [Rhizobium sp. TH2]|nr:hypothetical protein IHQ71_31070 [Rhizobium sp. TH2]